MCCREKRSRDACGRKKIEARKNKSKREAIKGKNNWFGGQEEDKRKPLREVENEASDTGSGAQVRTQEIDINLESEARKEKRKWKECRDFCACYLTFCSKATS